MPRRNHAAEVSALAVVVRTAVGELEASGRPPSGATMAALACVERWVAGSPVTAAELEAARAAAHGASDKAPDGAADRAVSWANAAVGNLAFVASKARGWQNGERAVMDAAECTISSIGADARGISERLEATRVAALARAIASGALPKAPRGATAAGKPRRIKAELAAFIGAVPSARLAALKAIVDPAKRGDDDALRARLTACKYPVHEPVLAFERRYGGLVMPEAPGCEGMDFWFGAFACLDGRSGDGPRGGADLAPAAGALVPVVLAPNDVIYFLDGDGVAWAQDTIEEPAATRFARDGDRMVARILIFQIAFERRFTGTTEELEGQHGEEVATGLGLPLVAEASDDLARVWADERCVVVEHRLTDGAWQTLSARRGRKPSAG